MIEWHRLFGLGLTDLFAGSSYRVELEKDLSLKQQLLDVIIIEQIVGRPIEHIPDGLDDLAVHNLVTYKSHREALDAWAIDELIGHYVNYRKQISPSADELLPVEDFRLYAVSTRHPKKLEEEVALTRIQDGVCEVCWGTHRIRILILSEMPRTKRNAIWQLFSAVPAKVTYGAREYHWHMPDLSTVLSRLYNAYGLEGIPMPYTVEDYRRELLEEALDLATPDQLIERLSTRGIPAEEWLKRLPAEERLKALSPEDIQAILRKYGPNEDGSRG